MFAQIPKITYFFRHDEFIVFLYIWMAFIKYKSSGRIYARYDKHPAEVYCPYTICYTLKKLVTVSFCVTYFFRITSCVCKSVNDKYNAKSYLALRLASVSKRQ